VKAAAKNCNRNLEQHGPGFTNLEGPLSGRTGGTCKPDSTYRWQEVGEQTTIPSGMIRVEDRSGFVICLALGAGYPPPFAGGANGAAAEVNIHWYSVRKVLTGEHHIIYEFELINRGDCR
jgi:hypothetical protein